MHTLRRKTPRDSDARYGNAPKVYERTKQDFTSPKNWRLRKAPTSSCSRNQARPRYGRAPIPRAIDLTYVSQDRKNFIVRNTGFICEACSAVVPPAKSTCRNHCTACLASKHVDDRIPGDRASMCMSIMPAVAVEGSNPDTLDLIHKCSSCGHTQRNKIATDDSREAIFELIKRAA